MAVKPHKHRDGSRITPDARQRGPGRHDHGPKYSVARDGGRHTHVNRKTNQRGGPPLRAKSGRLKG